MFRLLLVLAVAVPAYAHDLWLIPPAKAKLDEEIVITAHSGSDFPKSDHAPDPAKFAKRRLSLPSGHEGTIDAKGTKDNSGLLAFRAAKPGVHVVAVETTPKLITLAADKFNEYLVSDGLAPIYLLRAKEKTLDQPGKERYSKSPKAMLLIGDGPRESATTALGLPLEIVPVQDPFARKAGDNLPVRVWFKGKILADANLGWAYPNEGESPRGTVRTDAKGEALIPIAQAGLITIRLTHMTRPMHADYEWESFWTTLTWQVPK